MIKLTVIEEYYFCLYPWISFHKDWNSNVNCEQTDPTDLQQFHHNTVAETDKYVLKRYPLEAKTAPKN